VSAKLDFGIPRRVSRAEAARILASIPRPKLSRKVVDNALRWLKEDRRMDLPMDRRK
jgi:hypothetical protein